MKKILVLISILASFGMSARAQTDSIGVYSVRDSLIERIDVLKYKQTKISSSMFKGKAKLAFDGTTSTNVFTGSATFRLYFSIPSPYDAAKYYMFTPSYSAKDFGVGKFEVKKGVRYLTTANISILGSSSIGASEAKELKMETKQLRPNVYEITVSGPAGEYCIMPMINGAGGYSGVFDFTIK